MNSSYWQDKVEENIKRFGDSARTCDYAGESAFRSEQRSILKSVCTQKDLLILDVGCGNGRFGQPLLKNNKIVGIDISLGILNYAKKRGILTIQGDVAHLPFSSEIFDLVLCIEIIQCLDDLNQVLQEVVRVMKNGSQLILASLNPKSIIRRIHNKFEIDYKYMKMRNIEKVIQVLERNGLNKTEVFYNYYPFSLNISYQEKSIHSFLATLFIIKCEKNKLNKKIFGKMQ